MKGEVSWTWWQTDRGCSIRAATLVPPGAREGAAIVVLPGRTEFIEKYEEVLDELGERGWTTHILDWRGQGLSSRMAADRYMGHIDSFETYLHDLHTFFEKVVRPTSARVVILAHSMGGHVALRYLSERAPADVVGLITTAPMIDVQVGPVLYPILAAASATMCRLGLAAQWLNGARSLEQEADFRDNQQTSDPDRYHRMVELQRRRPELAIGGFSAGWARAAVASIQTLYRREVLARVHVPVCVLTAVEDTRVSVKAQRDAVEWLPDARQIELRGCKHEILLEQDEVRAVFWEAFDAFVATVIDQPEHQCATQGRELRER